ncbi:MAG: hypothetical protein LBS42_10725 [Tannerella sp.]|jgi:hypothetical protein|nr:hypothetical protein [Tannerella sp.]
MTDKGKLDELIVRIRKLLALTDEIYERDIYPISFFSQAYDITSKVQDTLREMEIAQIELFETQIKAHQAQIFSADPSREKKQDEGEQPAVHADEHVSETVLPPPPPPLPTPPPPPPKVVPEPPPPPAAPAPAPEDAVVDAHRQKETPHMQPPAPPTPVDAPLTNRTEGINKQSATADMKKWLTLNDRFRFGRELFGGDVSLMNRTVAELNEINSYEKGVSYLKSCFGWNFEDEIVVEFMAIMEKCFDK